MYIYKRIYLLFSRIDTVYINFRLELINPSAREVFIFELKSRQKSGGRIRRGEENMAQNLARQQRQL